MSMFLDVKRIEPGTTLISMRDINGMQFCVTPEDFMAAVKKASVSIFGLTFEQINKARSHYIKTTGDLP